MIQIEKVRKQAGMSQGELARLLNVTQGAVSHWEKGLTNPRLPLLMEIANIFGVSVDELLKESAEEGSNPCKGI